MIKIKNNIEELHDHKRHYFPGLVLELECTCGYKREEQFSTDEMLYPKVNEPFEYSWDCEDCDAMHDEKLLLKMSFEVYKG